MSENPNGPSPFQKMFAEFRERIIGCQIDVTTIPAPRRSIVYIDLIPTDCMPRDKFTSVKPLFDRSRKLEGFNPFVVKPRVGYSLSTLILPQVKKAFPWTLLSPLGRLLGGNPR